MSDRYLRQTIFAPIGEAGQCPLLESRVVVVGCGATGSVIASYLARAGIGRLVVVDRDFVERNNLQRQVLFTDRDVEEALPKAVAAERALRAVNPEIDVRGVVADVTPANVEPLLAGASLVMDGSDNFETRYLLNDACVKQVTPWIYSGAVGSRGMTMTVRPEESASAPAASTPRPRSTQPWPRSVNWPQSDPSLKTESASGAELSLQLESSGPIITPAGSVLRQLEG